MRAVKNTDGFAPVAQVELDETEIAWTKKMITIAEQAEDADWSEEALQFLSDLREGI